MNTQRDLKIAEAMRLEIEMYGDEPIYKKEPSHEIWYPEGNIHQLQIIEDWVVEQGYEIMKRMTKKLNSVLIRKIGSERFEDEYFVSNPSKPIAFLQAVEQLVDSLKEKK